MKNLKRWWANTCAKSATGVDIGRIISTLRACQIENRELRTENRQLANAVKAIHDYEISLATAKTHQERIKWSYTYSVTSAALGINQGRAEAKAARYIDKTDVAEMAESGIEAVRTGKNPQTLYMKNYWEKRWTGNPEHVAGSYREAATKQRKAKKLEKQS